MNNIRPKAKAVLKNAKLSPRKARLVIDHIRGENVVQALGFLENTRRAANPIVRDLLKSAIANAAEKDSNLNPDELVVLEARVDGGRSLKRMRPRAMGRGSLVVKRSSHIIISVG